MMEKQAVMVAWLPTAEERRDNTMYKCLQRSGITNHHFSKVKSQKENLIQIEILDQLTWH